MIEELLDGKDGEGHLSAVFSRAYQPMETRSSARMDREKKTEKDECLECIFMHETCRPTWSPWRGSLATQGFD